MEENLTDANELDIIIKHVRRMCACRALTECVRKTSERSTFVIAKKILKQADSKKIYLHKEERCEKKSRKIYKNIRV